MQKTLRILGTRGIPAAHGGFETFAEQLALYLVARGWRVVVYCQEDGNSALFEDRWRGVERVRIPVSRGGAAGTIVFDWRATRHAARCGELCLTLGYNTAVFCALLRLRGVPNLINMDGIEWARAKWGRVAKLWFWLNDWAGCRLGNHLVADHPAIAKHLETRVAAARITTIPYGADALQEGGIDAAGSSASLKALDALGLTPGRFLTVIARAEPENSLREIVAGFSARPRGVTLVVLGNYQQDNAYHRAVREAASDEVRFVGAVYDKAIVQALRLHSAAYLHGHQVGGTNPSLVEALGAGNAVFAHENRFNRWVAGDAACYFDGEQALAAQLDAVLASPSRLADMQAGSRQRFAEAFTWPTVLAAYESLLTRFLPVAAPGPRAAPHTQDVQGVGVSHVDTDP